MRNRESLVNEIYSYPGCWRKGAMELRQGQVEDQQAVETCVRAAYATYLVRMDREPAPLHADYSALLASGVVYVLASGKKVLGVLVMMPQEESLLIENVAVDPGAQGQGLGRALMAFAEQHARKAHLRDIRLYTNEAMTENLHFYRQLGFEEEGRRAHDGYHRVFLRKVLG